MTDGLKATGDGVGWQPTPELRWVQENVATLGKPIMVSTLQQRWVNYKDGNLRWEAEWRDIPVTLERD